MSKFLILLSFLLCSMEVFGLVKGENIEGQIIWIGDRQFVIDRGAEDGIAAGEYVRVIQNSRYKSRAISLKVSTRFSLWSLYYYYEPLVLDKAVTIKPSVKHPISEDVKTTMNLNIPSEKEFLRTIRPPKAAEDRSENADLRLEKRLKAKFDAQKKIDDFAYSYIEAYDPDLNDISLKVNVSPASFKNIEGSNEFAYRVQVKKDNGNVKDHKIDAFLSYERNSFVNTLTSQVISESRYDSRVFYEYGRFSEKLALFSFFSFERLREGSYFPIRTAINAGPIGIKVYLDDIRKQDDFLNSISMSYIPVVDFLSRDEFVNNPINGGRSEIAQTSQVNMRHNFIFQANADFFERRLNVNNITMFRPIQKIDGLTFDLNDINFRMETEFKYKFHKYFSVSYINMILNDQRSDRASELPSTEITNMFTLNYEKRF